MEKPVYKRVVVKLSGELLKAPTASLDAGRLRMVAMQLKTIADMGVQVAVVIGGGNIVRGAHAAEKSAIDRVTGDHMGMLATVINGLALMDTLEQLGAQTRVMSAIPMDRVAEAYILRRATHHLDKGRIVIFVAGTGNPYFSTDTAAALRANEIGAEVLIKATKVDGVYSADPVTHPDAKKFDTITFDEVINNKLQVMDATALTLCRENNLPILVLNLFADHALKMAVLGEKIGTKVS